MLKTLLTGAWLLAMSAAAAGAAAGPTIQPRPLGGGPDEEVAVIRAPQGRIVFKFFEADAPRTVANFKALARSGFYDGTTFHRIVPGFVIQGGDTLSRDRDLGNDGRGDCTPLPDEFNAARKHVRGTVSLAHTNQPNSGGCQFFICLAPAPNLDGRFAAFGQVIQGMDVVDRIVALANVPGVYQGALGPNPGKKAVMQSVTIEPLSRWPAPAAAGQFRPAAARPLGARPAARDTSRK